MLGNEVLRKIVRKLRPAKPAPVAAPVIHPSDFDKQTLPWLDTSSADPAQYVKALGLPEQESSELLQKLNFFRENGFLVLKNAIPHSEIDAYLQDLNRLFIDGQSLHTMITDVKLGNFALKERHPSTLDLSSIRVCDFHNNSEKGKQLILSKPIVDFLSHVFRMEVVAMQTLTFIKGSQQDWHQDFPYVVSQIPSHLAAAWIALEDVHPDAGPLGYFPGSHMIPKFNFGNGMLMTPESPLREDSFAKYLEETCLAKGLSPLSFTPQKGDVFIWHAALVHRGMPVNNPNLTRKSLVAHYSSEQAYRYDRRNPEVAPQRYEMNKAVVFGHPNYLNEENFFKA